MLTEYQIEALPARISERLNRINTEYLEEIGRVVKEIGELRPSDVHKIQRMYQSGGKVTEIVQKLAKESEKNIFEIYDMFDIVAKENYSYAEPFFSAKGLSYLPYEENKELQQYVKSLAKQTVGEYVNLTQHTAFAVFSNGGKSIAPLFDNNKDKVATSLSDTYTKVIDYAVSKVQTGVTDYQSAMREVMKAMADSGIRTVDYATGYSRRLESAVRQNILWGVKQCNQNTADMIGEQFGADGYEISYHSNPRPSHADMGGKQYAIGPARTVNGVRYPSFEKEAEPLLNDYGCLHFKFSILLGDSRPAYSKEQLAQFKAEDNKKIEFEGKEYTRYEASQLQKRIESEVRRQKDRATIAKAAGDDVMRREAQYKINLLTNKYAKLSKESGLPTKMERMQMKGFRKVKVDKILTTKHHRDIIKSNSSLLRIPQVPSSTITQKIASGEYNPKLSRQQYLKHADGTPQYEKYRNDRIARGDNPQSILTISDVEAQRFIHEKAGTGIVDVTRKGVPRNVEYVTANKYIGFYYGGGTYHKTKKVAIHYGGKSSHIVPIKGDFYD